LNLTASLGMPVLATREESAADLLPGCATAPPRARNQPQHSLAGYGRLLSTMHFMRWAIEREHFPSPEDVMARFQVCRATAYRWTAALAEAYGIDPAVRHGGRNP